MDSKATLSPLGNKIGGSRGLEVKFVIGVMRSNMATPCSQVRNQYVCVSPRNKLSNLVLNIPHDTNILDGNTEIGRNLCY